MGKTAVFCLRVTQVLSIVSNFKEVKSFNISLVSSRLNFFWVRNHFRIYFCLNFQSSSLTLEHATPILLENCFWLTLFRNSTLWTKATSESLQIRLVCYGKHTCTALFHTYEKVSAIKNYKSKHEAWNLKQSNPEIRSHLYMYNCYSERGWLYIEFSFFWLFSSKITRTTESYKFPLETT